MFDGSLVAGHWHWALALTLTLALALALALALPGRWGLAGERTGSRELEVNPSGRRPQNA